MKASKHPPLRLPRQKLRSSSLRGFTLVEILVAIAILAVVASLFLPAMGKMRDQANRVKCLSNIRQQLAGMQAYAADNKTFWSITTDSADDAPASLYPEYIEDARVFVCPSTRNVVRTNPSSPKTMMDNKMVFVDLTNNAAGGRTDKNGGHSYEYCGWLQYEFDPPYFKVPEKDGANKKSLSLIAKYGNASKMLLIIDADDTGLSNYPDATNNHGADGWNFGYADGHAEWVPAEWTATKFWEARQGLNN